MELKPRFENCKSYYKKAHVTDTDQGIELRSYNTPVCWVLYGKASVDSSKLTATTLRHIKEFLKQKGFKALSKSQIIKDYSGEQVWEV